MANIEEIKAHCASRFTVIEHDLNWFMHQVRQWFDAHPKLMHSKPAFIHSVKSRLKDKSHLAAKVHRKLLPADAENQLDVNEGWDPEDVFRSLTDLAGVRILLLHQEQFSTVHSELMRKIQSRDWVLHEEPKAYTWDPDSQRFFEELGINCKLKESHYTSVHYVIRPREDSPLACEIQVRTLFEEIWGEVDHTLNYPDPTDSVACKEQLRVLAKVVGAGSRLVDSIFKSAQVTPVLVENVIPQTGTATVIQTAPILPPTEKPLVDMTSEGEPDKPEESSAPQRE